MKPTARFLSVLSILAALVWLARALHADSSATVVRNILTRPPGALFPITRDKHRLSIQPEGRRESPRLVLFLIATSTRPADYDAFRSFAVKMGYDVLVLGYPNRVALPVCTPAKPESFRALLAFGRSRGRKLTCENKAMRPRMRRALEGYLNAVHPNQSIFSLIMNALAADPRLARRYLAGSESDGNPDGGRSLRAERILIAGHSQGAGHAAYLAATAKRETTAGDRRRFRAPFARVLLFAGPTESEQKDGDWIDRARLDGGRVFALLDRDDLLLRFRAICRNVLRLTGDADSRTATNFCAGPTDARADELLVLASRIFATARAPATLLNGRGKPRPLSFDSPGVAYMRRAFLTKEMGPPPAYFWRDDPDSSHGFNRAFASVESRKIFATLTLAHNRLALDCNPYFFNCAVSGDYVRFQRERVREIWARMLDWD